MKSASGKRRPEEAHGPHFCTFGIHRSAFKNSAKCRQTFSYFHSLILKISLTCRKKNCPTFTKFDGNSNFSIFYGKTNINEHLLDSQISRDFATEIVEFSANDFRTIRKNFKKVRKIRKTIRDTSRTKTVLTWSWKKHSLICSPALAPRILGRANRSRAPPWGSSRRWGRGRRTWTRWSPRTALCSGSPPQGALPRPRTSPKSLSKNSSSHWEKLVP